MDDSPSTAAHVRRPALVGAALVLVLDAAIAVPPPWTIAVAPVAFAGAAGRGVEPEVRAVAFAAGIVALFAAVPLGLPWPVPPLLALIVVAAAHRRREALPPPWLGPGALDRLTVAVAVASVPVTSVALVAFIGSGRADTETLTEVLVGRPTWVLVAAGVGFSLVNPLVEEVLFRGLLQTALRVAGLSAAAAIAVQAAAFGAIHLYGVPGGPLGVVMAAAWGAMLGVVRQRSGSIRLPWLVHVAANATMFVALVVIARADGLL